VRRNPESAAAEARRQAKLARAETLERILRWHLKAAGPDHPRDAGYEALAARYGLTL